MSSVRVRYQTIEFGDVDIHLRTLRDNQQFSDDEGVAEALGISSATWPIFGIVWDSGQVLAHLMFDYNIAGKRILEVGCGIALTSLVLNHRAADITATDLHPETEAFLVRNVLLNDGPEIPFVRTGWADVKSALGRFDLTEIPPAPRGMPQIEVTFDIDANGILNVSAKDKATGKSQNIVIKASSGLSDDEIDKMVADAESHAEEDRKFRELVDVRNQADGLIHAAEKTLKEMGEKATQEDRLAIENAISDLKKALDGDDKEQIETKTAALGEASGTLAQKLYAEQAAQGAEGGGLDLDAGLVVHGKAPIVFRNM